MRKLLFLVLCLAGSLCVAQQTQAPAPAKPQSEDISGMYTFLREGEFVQINIEDDGAVTGFVSRFGDDETDRDRFLDQFFEKGSYKYPQIAFTTRPVHNVWWEFAGTISRGSGKTPKDEAYRVIKGKLTRLSKDAQGKASGQSRDIEMKSFPSDEPDEEAGSDTVNP